MTPYNLGELLSTEEIQEYLKENELKVLKVADADSDGKITFSEFLFFLTVYQAPYSRIRRMFKRHGNKLDKKTFVTEIKKLTSQTSAGQKSV